MNDNKRNNFVLVIIIESWNFYIPENQHLYVSASFLFIYFLAMHLGPSSAYSHAS